jgi:hypothetical protein
MSRASHTLQSSANEYSIKSAHSDANFTTGSRAESRQGIDQGFPFGLEGGPMELASRARIPVIGIGSRPFLAMEIGVNGHAITGFEFIHQGMGASPIAFRVPPKGGYR